MCLGLLLLLLPSARAQDPASVRAELVSLHAQHGQVVAGHVEQGLRALDAAETRRAAGDVAGAARAEVIAAAALSVVQKKLEVRSAQARLRVQRARIERLRSRVGS